MGLSFFNAMRARQKVEQAQAEKTSSLKVEEVEEPKEPVTTAEPEKDEKEVSPKKKTDAEKLKGKKE